MTDDISLRIGKLEGKVDGLERWVESIDEKVDKLLAIANQGRGAWMTILKIGGFIVAISTFVIWSIKQLAHLFMR